MFGGGGGSTTAVVGNTSHPDAVVIWCHGLGDSPRGWQPFAEVLATELPDVKVVLPCAPVSPVSCNGGMPMTSWMDLEEIPISPSSPDPNVGITESLAILNSLVEQQMEETGLPSERVLVGGFSQGGAMSLAAVLLSEKKLAGCCCLSGWALPSQQLDRAAASSTNKTSPFLVCHGEADGVVLPSCGKGVVSMLRDAEFPHVTSVTWPGVGHGLGDDREVIAFIRGVLA